ncbi:MAG: extracellular solute-binding protein [Chloroflexi bacterium]|nr:extracellular solute-binding protein [Chloroflexota bacterium]MCY3583633.1 extracellular solute-binding protein [Chloroflexota bacterium]MCY3715896.1 extracellular solute-binding protein [Chloroflexota bacterium]MDE2650069.1 extracellular solute-binding protein [Chloroflexota bacterium]MXV94182.1 extracellular solute-binding protein [Chloroflexota bacterium]
MKLKRLGIIAALLLLIALPTLAQDSTTITWLSLGWPVDDVIAEFEAQNPDINVEAEQVGFNDLFAQIQVRLGARSSVPDVISVDVPLVSAYAFRNWLLPLDPVFTGDEVEDWLPAAVDAGSYEGTLYAAPVSTSTQLLFYNSGCFDRAGLMPPGADDRLTWEEIADIAQQMTFDDDGDGTPDVWGFIWEQMVRIYQLQALPESLGGAAIGEDGLTVDGVINSQAWIDAFTYYYNMFNVWNAAPQGEEFWPADIFETGNICMFVGGPWNIPRFANNADLDIEWGVSRHPYFADGEPATPTGSWHIGVNANTENRDAATRFVHWLSTGEGAEMWWRDGSGDFPAQQSVLALFATEAEFDALPMSYMRTAADEATVNPRPRAVTVGFLEYEQILQNIFQDIRNGADVEESLNLAVQRIESEMAKYR